MLKSGKSRFKIMLCVFSLFFCLASLRAEEVYAAETPAYKEAVELFESGDTVRAIGLMKKHLQEHPDNAEAYEKLGSMLLRKGELDEALNAFDAGLNVNPRLHSVKTGKGFTLLKKGNIKEAESTFKDALTLNPKPSMTHYGLGLLYEELKDYENAMIHYKDGIQKYKSGRQ